MCKKTLKGSKYLLFYLEKQRFTFYICEEKVLEGRIFQKRESQNKLLVIVELIVLNGKDYKNIVG